MANKFAEETKKIIKGTSQNTCAYWKSLENPEDTEKVYYFCMRMYEILVSSSKDQYLDDDHQAMYSTLLVLEFYKNTKAKPEKWIQQSVKYFEQNKTKVFEHAKLVIDMFIKNSDQIQFALNFLSAICHVNKKFSWKIEPGQEIEDGLTQASQYHQNIDMKKRDKPYKKLSHLSYCQAIQESKIMSLSYCCFLDYIRSANFHIKKKIYLHILDLLKGMIHSLRHTNKGQKLLTILLHTIQNLIKFYGCNYQDILKDMIYYINIIRNSPSKNSDIAAQLFFLIHNEIKCPGYTFRRQLKRRFVGLDFKKSSDLASQKYYLTFKKISFACPQYCTITNLRKLTILNIIGTCKVQGISKYWSIIQPLDAETTYNLYYKIMKIVDIVINLETYESIHKLMRQSIIQLLQMRWVPYKKVKEEQIDELKDLVINQNSNRFFQFPNFQIIQLRPESLADPNYQYYLQDIIDSSKKYPFNQYFSSILMQFIFLGNDYDLHKIINTIAEILIKTPPKQYQKLSFYIIPIREGQCYLSEYLSYKDLWYRRFIYNVFRQKTLFPWVSLDDPEIKDIFPSYLFTKSLHMYIRQAQRKVPFQIFKCEIMESQTNQEKTLYFINNILIGASLQVDLLKGEFQKEKKYAHVDEMQLYLDKIKKIPSLTLNITVRYKEPGSQSLITKIQKFLNVQDIQICNTPKPYFFGYSPDPLSQYTEISILTTQSAKVFRYQLQSRQNFKRHSQDQISESFRDLFISMSCESIIIERSEGMKEYLRIMIDGAIINKVQRFKVTPAFAGQQKSKFPLTLPVRCFLPFQR